MEFSKKQLEECIIVNKNHNISLSDSEASKNDLEAIPKKEAIHSAFNELMFEDLKNQIWKSFKLLPSIKKKQLGELVRQMMELGYTNFSEVTQYYIYSFTFGKFMKKKSAINKFGWKKPLQVAIQERILRDMEAELDYVEDNAEELI